MSVYIFHLRKYLTIFHEIYYWEDLQYKLMTNLISVSTHISYEEQSQFYQISKMRNIVQN